MIKSVSQKKKKSKVDLFLQMYVCTEQTEEALSLFKFSRTDWETTEVVM